MSLCFNIIKLLVIFFYFTGTLLFFTATLTRDFQFKCWSGIAAVSGFILHSGYLFFFALAGDTTPVLQAQTIFALLSWLVLFFCFFLCWKLRLVFLSMLVSPLALVLFLSFAIGSPQPVPAPEILSWLWFSLYIGGIFFSISIIVLCAVSSLLYLYIEKKIKNKSPISRFSKELPSLTGFDRFNHLCTLIGFPLYTLGLLSGFVWTSFSCQQTSLLEPQKLLIVLVWCCYAYLFYQRNFWGWKGKKPAQYSFLIFILSLASLFGANFLTL